MTNSNLRIGFIGASSNSNFGGVEVYMNEITSRLIKKDISSKVYVPNLDKTITQEAEFIKIPYWDLPLLRVLSVGYSAMKRANDACDILHFQNATTSIFSYKTSKPTLATIHGSPRVFPDFKYFRRWGYNCCEAMALKKVDKVITVTPRLKNIVRRRYGVDAEYIPHGATIKPVLPPDLIKSLGLKGEDYILFVGRLVREKGPEQLIEAYRKTSRQFKLVIAGADDYYQKGRSYMKYLKDISPAGVVFTGRIDGPLKQELYSNALAFVSPLKVTGLPLAVIEAMSYGRCVVCTDADYVQPEFTNPAYENTLRYKTESTEALVNILEYQLKDQAAVRRMGDQGKEFVKNNHSWDRVVDRYADIYNHLIRR